jgi:hypothetical protein
VPPPLSGADGLKIANPCPEIQNIPLSEPRKLAWCRLREVTEPHPIYTELPQWEFFIPDEVVMGAPNDIATLEFPNERSVGQKTILYNLAAYEHVRYTTSYWRPCVPTLNFLKCQSGLSHWMMPFPPNAKIVKTFWVDLSHLPESSDPDDFYSYEPPNGNRMYLVGMHLNTKDIPGGNSGTGSWLWATFFVPPPPGDTEDKGGRPLSQRFHVDCQVGHRNDMPDEIAGVWRQFVLCTNDEGPSNHKCGNPWGPKDECEKETCNACHTRVGAITYPESIAGLNTHQLQWLFTLRPSSGVTDDCYEQIQAALANGDPTPWDAYATEGCD